MSNVTDDDVECATDIAINFFGRGHENEAAWLINSIATALTAERTRHAAEVERLTHGHYAFLLRHYALAYVRVHDQTLHDQGFSEAYQRIQREGGAAYEDVVQQLAAEVAALRGTLEAALPYLHPNVVMVADAADARRHARVLASVEQALSAAPQPDDRTARLEALERAGRLWQSEADPDEVLTEGEAALCDALDALRDNKEVHDG